MLTIRHSAAAVRKLMSRGAITRLPTPCGWNLLYLISIVKCVFPISTRRGLSFVELVHFLRHERGNSLILNVCVARSLVTITVLVDIVHAVVQLGRSSPFKLAHTRELMWSFIVVFSHQLRPSGSDFNADFVVVQFVYFSLHFLIS